MAMLLLSSAGVAQQRPAKFEQLTLPVKEYRKAEWAITIPAKAKNPYDQRQIAVNMVLTSPSGQPLVLPCFFDKDGDSVSYWRARFAPQDTGTYAFYFSYASKTGNGRSAGGHFNALPSASDGFLHKNNYWTFRFDDGKLFRGVGENVGWESRSFENDKWTYDRLLPELAKNGGNFFRTWMCYWNLPLEWNKVRSTKRYHNSSQYFNPGAIARMDQLVNMCDSLHLYFMLTLDWHGLLLPGGGWKNSPYNAANGGPARTPTDFFASQEARQRYKNKLRYIIARWGYSTNIAAIEFFNEIDNAAFNPADSVIIPLHLVTEWHGEMSRYLKDIDPYGHMVTTSVSHRDIPGLNSIAYIDFNQKHIYKHTEKIPYIYGDYIQTYGKPYVIGEFGYRWEDADPKYARNADYDYRRGLWYGLFSPCPILPMSWWWEFFDEQGMMPVIKPVRKISEEMMRAGKGSFEQLPVQAGHFQALGLRCGDKLFVYLLNNSSGELSEPVSFGAAGPAASIQCMNPETGVAEAALPAAYADGRLVFKNVKLAERADVLIVVDEGKNTK